MRVHEREQKIDVIDWLDCMIWIDWGDWINCTLSTGSTGSTRSIGSTGSTGSTGLSGSTASDKQTDRQTVFLRAVVLERPRDGVFLHKGPPQPPDKLEGRGPFRLEPPEPRRSMAASQKTNATCSLSLSVSFSDTSVCCLSCLCDFFCCFRVWTLVCLQPYMLETIPLRSVPVWFKEPCH